MSSGLVPSTPPRSKTAMPTSSINLACAFAEQVVKGSYSSGSGEGTTQVIDGSIRFDVFEPPRCVSSHGHGSGKRSSS